MTQELSTLAWLVVLALVQIALAASFRNTETGMKFNLGPRDTPPPPMGTVTARLYRAQDNLMETLPLFAIAVLAAHLGGKTGAGTVLGCQLFLWGRVAYLPLYAFGIPVARTLAWTVSIIGLVKVLMALLA